MTIYIESFLFENLIINYCLLRLIKVTTKSKTSKLSIFLGSVLGAGFSVFGAMFLNSNLVLNILKQGCAILMLLIAFKTNKRQFFINYVLLFVFTYALMGAITALSGSSYITSYGIVVSSKISLLAVTIFVTIITYIIEIVTKTSKLNLKTKDFIYPITLIDGKQKITINAYLDTGNLLNIDGHGVVVLGINELCKLKNMDLLSFCLNSKDRVSTKTVCGNDNLRLFKIDSMEIKIRGEVKVFKEQYVASTPTTTFKNVNYQALLSPLLI